LENARGYIGGTRLLGYILEVAMGLEIGCGNIRD